MEVVSYASSAHHHAWQAGPVVEWSHNGYSGQPGDVPQYQNAGAIALVCACGAVRLVRIPEHARADTWKGPVEL